MSHLTTADRRPSTFTGRLSALLLLAVLIGQVAPARAALVPLSFEELTHKSKYVVTGRVVRARSYFEEVENLGNVVFTDVTIRVAGRLLGTYPNKEITLKVPGGVVGKLRQVWAEASEFSEGEMVLVFVRELRKELRVTGWRQGKYRLSPDGATVLGRGDLPIGRSMPLSKVRGQIELFDATRPPPSAEPSPSAPEDEQ